MSHNSLPTVDELVGTLKRSFIPTIVIEGPDDVFIYRWLKSNLSNALVSLLPCGGRSTLFSVFDRREEFSNSNVVYVADMDLYKFEGIPNERNEIIFTSGYSIENDIYGGSTIEDLLDSEDKNDFDLLKNIIGRWFSFEIQKYMDSITSDCQVSLSISSHINEICPVGRDAICPLFSRKISYVEPRVEYIELIGGEYFLNVRGKQLFQMLSRYLSKKGRFSNFSDKNLIEIALKLGDNVYLATLINSIQHKLAA